MFDYKNYNYYMLMRPTPGGWTFVGFEKDGKTYKAVQSIDSTGRIRNFNLYFSDRERIHRSHVNQEVTVIVDNDIHNTQKMKVSKYLEMSPYFGIVFKKVDENKDAKEVVSVKANRIKAESEALNLIDRPEKLAEIAQLLGVFKDDTDQQHRAVLEFAGQHPDRFMEMLDAPDSEIKALVLKGVNAGTLRQTGKVISWDSEVLGADVDDAVKALVKDQNKLKALKAAVKKQK
jgi:hypothetical protein